MPAAVPRADLEAALDAALLQAGVAGSGEVLIAGAGIGGLAAALALARRGIRTHVLERRAAFSEQGAGIQIGPNGTRILRELGVAEALRPHAGVPQWLIVHEAARGRELTRMPLNPAMEQRFGSPYWAVHREDLHAALLMQARADDKIQITMDAAADVVASSDAAAGVATLDGRCFTGAVVIGADGLLSRVRGALSRDTGDLIAAGKSAYRAVMPAGDLDRDLVEGGTRIWLAPDAHVVHYAVRGGTELAMILIVDEVFAGEGWSHSADPAPIVARLSLTPRLRALLSQPRSWRKWALTSLSASPPMAQDRIALLGDAAHPVLPFLAQGGVLALEDGVVLARLLASGDRDVRGALQEYGALRRARAERVAAASRRNGRIYHLGGLSAVARDAGLRLIPGARVVAGYDWIYGWVDAAK